MSDPHAVARLNVTIKFPESARYKADNPWLVFEGTSPQAVKALIAEAFGMENVDELSYAEVVYNAQQTVTALGNVASTGARAIGGSKGGDPFDGVSRGGGSSEPAKDAEPEGDPIEVAIAGAESVETLKTIWAENQERFNEDAALMDKWKARGKELQAAAA